MRLVVRGESKADLTTVGACSVDAVKKLGSEPEYKTGYFLLVSQPGCPHCAMMREILDQTVKTSKPIVEASLEDKECGSLARALKVEITPTVFYYENGEEKSKLVADGKLTWKDVQSRVAELAKITAA